MGLVEIKAELVEVGGGTSGDKSGTRGDRGWTGGD